MVHDHNKAHKPLAQVHFKLNTQSCGTRIGNYTYTTRPFAKQSGTLIMHTQQSQRI